jgi:hypothetical protein
MADAPSLPFLLLGDKLLSFAQAARLIPPSRRGRPVSPSCLWRWHRSGVKTPDGRTVRLEAVWLVNRLVTSEEAVRRFIAAQQTDRTLVPALPKADRPAQTRTPDRLRRDSENALRDLQEMRN